MKISHAVLALSVVTFADISGTVVDEKGKVIENAVVSIKTLPNLLPDARTLSDKDGKFVFKYNAAVDGDISGPDDSGSGEGKWEPVATTDKETSIHAFANAIQRGVIGVKSNGIVALRALDLNGKVLKQENISVSAGNYTVDNAAALTAGLPMGSYLVVASADGKNNVVGKFSGGSHGGVASLQSVGGSRHSGMSVYSYQELRKEAAGAQSLIVRKTGFLPETLAVVNPKDYGKVTLKRDPVEDQIDELMKDMTLDAKIAQMMQPLVGESCGSYACGSVLEGGGEYSSTVHSSAWVGPIPTSYGKDNVHGMGDVNGATIFPHNIGLGATRDSAVVRKIGKAVAEEMWAAYIDLNFSPAVSTPQDEHWGRTYEGFGEKAELGVMMGAAYLRGLQGENFNAPWRVTGTVKHFVGDGGTNGGVDRGNSTMTEEQLRTIHLPPYIAAIEQGAQSVMASFNQINGVHQHVDSLRLTGILKVELGFDGYVIADWEGIANSMAPGSYSSYASGSGSGASVQAVKKAINAGIDMAMVPYSLTGTMSALKSLVESGDVSKDRINDAVRRILRVKIRGGRIANPAGPADYVGKSGVIGSADHRAIAREAVRKSLVLLKNDNKALPLSKKGNVFVTGSHADNSKYQCGGWTQGWSAASCPTTGTTTILAGFKSVASSAVVSSADDANTIVYVVGENTYAEWEGDVTSFENLYVGSLSSQISQINTWKSAGKKVVVVLISGRPLPFTDLIEASDAFVAAWLPGTEGAGVADVLFGDYKPTGKLPHTWPKTADQVPINDGDGKEGLFPYGYGLTY